MRLEFVVTLVSPASISFFSSMQPIEFCWLLLLFADFCVWLLLLLILFAGCFSLLLWRSFSSAFCFAFLRIFDQYSIPYSQHLFYSQFCSFLPSLSLSLPVPVVHLFFFFGSVTAMLRASRFALRASPAHTDMPCLQCLLWAFKIRIHVLYVTFVYVFIYLRLFISCLYRSCSNCGLHTFIRLFIRTEALKLFSRRDVSLFFSGVLFSILSL